MATIKQRKKSFSVIYWYLDNTGERKQKWDTLGTRKEAKQRKAFVEYYQEKFGYVIVPLEEQFAQQIVSAVEKSMEKALPVFLAGCMAGLSKSNAAVPPAESPATDPDADVDWDFLGE